MKPSQIRVSMLFAAFIVLLALSVQAAETPTRPAALDGALRAFGRMRKLLQVTPTPGAGVSRASENIATFNAGSSSGGTGGSGSEDLGTTTDKKEAVLRQLCGSLSSTDVNLPLCAGRR